VRVRFWDAEFEAGDRYFDTDLRASNDILHDVPALRARLEQDGYLLIRDLRDRDAVLSARRQILEKLSSKGMLGPGSDLMDGIVNPAYTAPVTTGTRDNEEFRLLSAVQDLRQMPQVMEFFDRLLGGPARPFDFHWVRVAAPGAESAIHSDIVFMGAVRSKSTPAGLRLAMFPSTWGRSCYVLAPTRLRRYRNTGQPMWIVTWCKAG
jgi:hypothetical protein